MLVFIGKGLRMIFQIQYQHSLASVHYPGAMQVNITIKTPHCQDLKKVHLSWKTATFDKTSWRVKVMQSKHVKTINEKRFELFGSSTFNPLRWWHLSGQLQHLKLKPDLIVQKSVKKANMSQYETHPGKKQTQSNSKTRHRIQALTLTCIQDKVYLKVCKKQIWLRVLLYMNWYAAEKKLLAIYSVALCYWM